MSTPEISVVLPCSNDTVLAAMQGQTFTEFELIVPNQNTFETRGAAYNWGLKMAAGEYVLFLHEEALPKPVFLERMLDRARSTNADLVICDLSCRVPGKRDYSQKGVQSKWVKDGAAVFNLDSCLDFIIQIAADHLENRLYRRDFLEKKGVHFDDLSSCENLSFSAVTLIEADSIAWLQENLISCPEFLFRDVRALWFAVESGMTQFRQHHKFVQIEKSVAKFVVNNLVAGLKYGIREFESDEAKWFYQQVHELFNEPEFKELTPAYLFNTPLYREFSSVQKHNYETMKNMYRRKLIVSVTSYPARINLLRQSLETIYAQTRKADAVVLWLAKDQFPNGDLDIPEDLRQLIAQKKLLLRWCSDLKGHKKYFWAFQEFRDHLVITIDDDLLYPSDLLECLWKSYLLYPEAVSAVRTHLMLVSEEGKLLPYSDWIMETDACLHQPSMQLMATGGAGTLYPPELFRNEIFNQEAVEQTCILADDLWLKAMEVISNIPTVLARPFDRLKFVPDSQEEALHNLNVGKSLNDTQMNAIIHWLDQNVENHIFMDKLMMSSSGQAIHGIEAVAQHLDKERKANRWKRLTLEQELLGMKTMLQSVQRDKEQALKGLSVAEIQLQEATKQLGDKDCLVLRMQQQLKQTEGDLNRTRRFLNIERENAPIRRQLKNIGTMLKAQDTKGFGWCMKYLIYYLAWVPEKMLEVMMYYLQNGAKQTLKQIYRRLFRRRQ